MNSVRSVAAGFLLASPFVAFAQTPFLYHLTFQGTCYQTNSTGNFVATPITDKTLVQDAAKAGGLNPASVALVYHIQSSGLGDTIDFVNATNGSTLANMFGLYFGDDPTLGRSAATNSTRTEIRRVDYVYTQRNSTYSSFNTHSMGASLTVKRFMTDTNGTTHATVQAQMEWIVNPAGTNGTKVCTASFNTTTPFP